MAELSFNEITALLRAEHSTSTYDSPGGWTWSCSCGAVGQVGASYPTESQAASRRDRHLRAARKRIAERERKRP